MRRKTTITEKKTSENENKLKDFIADFQAFYDEIDNSLKEKLLKSKAWELHKNICENRLYTSKTVMIVFCFASKMAHDKTNCLTEIMFSQAIKRAEELDEYFENNNKPIGPLHGIPFSIKDTFDFEDFGISLFQFFLLFFRFEHWPY